MSIPSAHKLKKRKRSPLPQIDRELADTAICIEKQIIQGRWMAVLQDPETKHTTRIPHAHFVWLKHNPVFPHIPHGYVVHHLDGDELNDDILNLVIMTRQQHTAYHFKNFLPTPKNLIGLDDLSFKGIPIREPKIYKRNDIKADRYYLRWHQNGKRYYLASYKGKPITTEKEAERIKAEIWHPQPTPVCT